MQDPKVLVALDYQHEADAFAFIEQISPAECRLKVGKEMFTLFGPQFVRQLVAKGFDVFLDLKFHDIPNTVAKAVAASAELGVWMVNVHASGGERMMRAAREALLPYGDKAPWLIGVTVLTSMEQSDMAPLGLDVSPAEQVIRLATLAKTAGLDGVVCSAEEASALKALLGTDFKLVTPGIRPSGSAAGGEGRERTPPWGAGGGADH